MTTNYTLNSSTHIWLDSALLAADLMSQLATDTTNVQGYTTMRDVFNYCVGRYQEGR